MSENRFQIKNEENYSDPPINFSRLDHLAESIPEFRSPRFVLMKLEHRDGQDKPTKVPYYVTEGGNVRRASSTNQATWLSWRQVREAFIAGRSLPKNDPLHFDGLGIVFHKQDDVMGADLDHCRNVDGSWNDDALEFLRKFAGAYLEVSHSGNGLHAIFKAKKPAALGDKEGIKRDIGELYNSGRYFVLTGVLPDGASDIDELVNCQGACERFMAKIAGADADATSKLFSTVPENGVRPLSNADIIKKLTAKGVPNREYNAELFSGVVGRWRAETKALDTSESASDFALAVASLSVWSRPVAESVFRRSGLMASIERRKAGHVDDYVRRTFDQAERASEEAKSPRHRGRPRIDDADRVTPEQKLIEIFDKNGWDIFREKSTSLLYVLFSRNGLRHLACVDSRDFISRFNTEYYSEVGRAAPQASISQALAVLSDRAYNKPMIETYLRAAKCNGKFYYNLADEAGRVVEISADGWRVITNAPVFFKNTGSMSPLPMPESDGSLTDLRPFFRGNDDDFVKVCLWAFHALIPDIAHFGLCINAEQDSGKTVLTKTLKKLIDPCVADVTSPLEKSDDIVAVCSNVYVLAVDNLSKLIRAVSDNYCRLLTGSGHISRQLFTNGEIFMAQLRCLLIINGIGLLIKNPDLASRMLNIDLKHFAEGECGSELELSERFDKVHPRILGALFSAMSAALKHESEHPDFKMDFNNRMNDAVTLWIRAELAGALPFKAGTLKRILLEQNDTAASDLITSDTVLMAFQSVLEDHFNNPINAGFASWPIYPADLYKSILAAIPDKNKPNADMPAIGRKFNKWLDTYAPTFRQAGYDIERVEKRDSRGRKLIITSSWTNDPTREPRSSTDEGEADEVMSDVPF